MGKLAIESFQSSDLTTSSEISLGQSVEVSQAYVAMDSAKSQAFEVSCWASVNWRCAKEVCKGVMSKAKWFAVRKPSTGEIIATSANLIVPPKFRGPTKMLYYIKLH